ncbi:ras association domain-containing protein 5 isoform X1 [Tachyglossus aculeatus]|uniref:ras association domain-containing protein 5 isoform X1 n=1 Tax=Tachyglossus aculeatus TaxID=9261 RepID=UPI0018F65E3B|nr:ras association domain-containing protein 5 isoform X1 [Tachyglossus aculeatus]
MAMAFPALGQRPFPLVLDADPPPPAAPALVPRPARAARAPRPGLQQRLRRRPGAPRPRDVRSIFQPARAPRGTAERGDGHRNGCHLCPPEGPPPPVTCAREVMRMRLRCTDCQYTCHQECQELIQLDCSQQDGPAWVRPPPGCTLTSSSHQIVCKPVEEEEEEEEEKPRAPTLQEIKQKIDSYNAKEKNCLGMKLSDDGTYTGFIKVHLKLQRPVTVPAGVRPQSVYDALKEVNPAAVTDRRTSFYLPLDAVKQLHISSTTTVSEVIQGLLKKFMVVDSPQKFALFKQVRRDGQVLFQKLPIADCPLYLRLSAGPDTDVLSFVLKENETGEVEWDAFSIPELQNFLIILDKEENEKIQQVHRKYNKFRQKLQKSLRDAQGQPG